MPIEMISPQFATDRKRGAPPFAANATSGGEAAYLQTRIFIIEDEMMIAWMLESLLSEAGFTDIVLAANGEEACRLAAELTPGLVISDINLGAGINGIDTSVAICRAAAIPVLFVTAYADEATRNIVGSYFPRAEVLRKPIDRMELTIAVARALRPTPGN